MPDELISLALIMKWALYLGALGASGTVFCALLFGLKQVRALAGTFALIALTATCVSFSLKGAALTGDAAGVWDPEMLSLLWQTKSGLMLKVQVAGLLVLLAGLTLGAFGLVVSAFGGLVTLLAFATIGHVADGGDWLIRAVLVLHLSAAAMWFGVLIPLYRLAGDPKRLSDAASLGARFGRLAVWVLPVLLLAGVAMTYVLVGAPAAVTGTPYGRVLLAKTAIVILLLGLGAANKLRFVPALARGDATAAVHLRCSIAVEWIGFAAIFALTATLTTSLSPPA